MNYEQEVIERLGSAGGFEVLIHQPHLDWELTTIALDTPDGRWWDLDAEEAAALAELLKAAQPVLQAAREAARQTLEEE